MFEFGPIWRTILRNKVGALLIVIQISLTLGVISNAAYVINQRLQKMDIVTGIDEANLFSVMVRPISNTPITMADIARDLSTLRQLAEVQDATYTMSPLLLGGGSSLDITIGDKGDADYRKAGADWLMMDSHGLSTMGVALEDGRFFSDAEVRECIAGRCQFNEIVISRGLADALFGQGVNPIGKQLNILSSNPTIIGVTKPFYGTYLDKSHVNGVMILPRVNVDISSTIYEVRAKDGLRDQAMLAVAEALRRSDNNRVVSSIAAAEDHKARVFQSSRLTVTIMQFTIVVVIGITILGIVGLTSLWVNQRRRQIGIRRALGATQAAIVRYFLTENLMLTTLGIVIGLGLSMLINQQMVQHYHVSALPLSYISIGMLGVWVLGIGAALAPVIRATKISPAIATRSV